MGDSLKMLEFKDGKHTGRTIDADIIYMLEDYTGLEEGYCILGIAFLLNHNTPAAGLLYDRLNMQIGRQQY